MQEAIFWILFFIWWLVVALVVGIIVAGMFDEMGRRG